MNPTFQPTETPTEDPTLEPTSAATNAPTAAVATSNLCVPTTNVCLYDYIATSPNQVNPVGTDAFVACRYNFRAISYDLYLMVNGERKALGPRDAMRSGLGAVEIQVFLTSAVPATLSLKCVIGLFELGSPLNPSVESYITFY